MIVSVFCMRKTKISGKEVFLSQDSVLWDKLKMAINGQKRHDPGKLAHRKQP